jgi:hypothetical protein
MLVDDDVELTTIDLVGPWTFLSLTVNVNRHFSFQGLWISYKNTKIIAHLTT